jgi:adenylate kinase family enzyme
VDKLQEYISSNEYISTLKELARWQELLVESTQCLSYFPTKKAYWSYKISENTKENESNPSASTNSMIMFTIARCLGRVEKRSVSGYGQAISDDSALNSRLEKALEIGQREFYKYTLKTKTYFESSTWGIDDPLTLSWLTELISIKKNTFNIQLKTEVKTKASKRLKETAKSPQSPIFQYSEAGGQKDEKHIFALHSFPLLRLIHIWKTRCSQDPIEIKIDKLYHDCRNRLNAQIAADQLHHGDFDACELVLATETAMLLKGAAVLGNDLLQVIFKILEKRQENNIYWRPLKPLWHNEQGTVMLPLSIETANSILRIHAMMVKEGIGDDEAESRLNMISQYARWLESRKQSFQVRLYDPQGWKKPKVDVVGWVSEHVNKESIIHPWETAQAILFLADLTEAIDQQLQKQLIKKGDFLLRSPKRISEKSSDLEPLLGVEKVNPSLFPYTFLEKKMLSLFGREHSILLYGPPGTGKTTFAEQLASCLGCQMLTITPSDFIAGGVEQVEFRAKAIFTMLERQKDIVVLFDEIDRLIMDRDHPNYSKQADMLQIMTPSMLDKLNNLRNKQRLSFIIATNYMERIDSAIIRPGRIDRCCILTPPNQKQRENFLDKFFKDMGLKISADVVTEFAKLCVLMVHKELEQIAKEVKSAYQFKAIKAIKKIKKIEEIKNFEEIKSNIKSVISLESYQKRFKTCFTSRQMPIVEFLTLLALCEEAKKQYSILEDTTITTVYNCLGDVEWETILNSRKLQNLIRNKFTKMKKIKPQ